VVFDFNRQQFVRINAVGCKLYVEDCIFGNAGVSQRFQQGMHDFFQRKLDSYCAFEEIIPFIMAHYEMLNNMVHQALSETRYGKQYHNEYWSGWKQILEDQIH
jgi:hypothetical protein